MKSLFPSLYFFLLTSSPRTIIPISPNSPPAAEIRSSKHSPVGFMSGECLEERIGAAEHVSLSVAQMMAILTEFAVENRIEDHDYIQSLYYIPKLWQWRQQI